MPQQEPVVKPIGVKEVKITDLEPNPHNPRMLFDDAPMKTLEESIKKVGILVPLTVYEKAKVQGKYVILDGQRRWICAQRNELSKVPVNVVPEPLKAVTEFRTIKQHISNAAKAGKVDLLSKRLREFIDDPELKVDHLEIEGADVAAQVRHMKKEIGKLKQVISEIDVEQFYGEEKLWEDLEALVSIIREKLRQLGRRSKQ
jgi:ParB-like nuclease domain